LEFSGRPRVVLLAPGNKPEVAAEAPGVADFLSQHVDLLEVDMDFSSDLTALEPDFVAVLGGDGSILRSAHQMGTRQVPALGINLGKLGFLADLSLEELPKALPCILRGECKIVEHIMLDCQVLRGDQVVAQKQGLNETAVWAGSPFGIVDIDLYIDSIWATTYSCDGLILCTPVGSTAHSLSAGGPIVRKDLEAFVISPINPHTLTNRPVVDSAERVYELAVKEPLAGTSVVVDGHVLCTLGANERVRVTRSQSQFKMIEAPGHNYYRTLRDKLGWGGRLKLREPRSGQ
jgi:NAD+ kinase